MSRENREPHNKRDGRKGLALAQGAYYVATGLWSLADIDSFQKVTGPKTDKWLVKTVGTLVTAIGGTLLVAGSRDEDMGPEIPLLAAGSALGLAGIDAWYAGKGRISPIYLADAAAELGLAAGWAAAWKADGAAGTHGNPS